MITDKKVTRIKNKVVLVPLGEVDYGLVNRIATHLVSIFNIGVDILQWIKLPQEAFNQKRGQYYSTVILNKLELLRASPRESIIGIVDEDLYIPALDFTYGEADPSSKVAVLSIYRLRQQSLDIYEDENLFFSRAIKEAAHLLGHLFDLKHCANPKCVMHFSASLLETDRKSDKLCDNCKRKAKIETLT
jgi:archaemetzincin